MTLPANVEEEGCLGPKTDTTYLLVLVRFGLEIRQNKRYMASDTPQKLSKSYYFDTIIFFQSYFNSDYVQLLTFW